MPRPFDFSSECNVYYTFTMIKIKPTIIRAVDFNILPEMYWAPFLNYYLKYHAYSDFLERYIHKFNKECWKLIFANENLARFNVLHNLLT